MCSSDLAGLLRRAAPLLWQDAAVLPFLARNAYLAQLDTHAAEEFFAARFQGGAYTPSESLQQMAWNLLVWIKRRLFPLGIVDVGTQGGRGTALRRSRPRAFPRTDTLPVTRASATVARFRTSALRPACEAGLLGDGLRHEDGEDVVAALGEGRRQRREEPVARPGLPWAQDRSDDDGARIRGDERVVVVCVAACLPGHHAGRRHEQRRHRESRARRHDPATSRACAITWRMKDSDSGHSRASRSKYGMAAAASPRLSSR